MRFVPDAKAAAWIENLAGTSADFEWDKGNRSKHGKHGVSPGDIEALFTSTVVFAGQIVEPRHSESRWLLLGMDHSRRRLALIFTRRGDKLRAISCRAMRKNEQKLYEEATRESEKE